MTTVKLSVDDPEFVEKILYEVKKQGHFDSFRKACLADVGELLKNAINFPDRYFLKLSHFNPMTSTDTQPAFQNLHSRVEDSVQKFLNRQVWTSETNKNKLREEMRHHIIQLVFYVKFLNSTLKFTQTLLFFSSIPSAGYLESGVSRIVDQVMEQKMESIRGSVEEILYKYVGIEKPLKDKHNGSLEVDTDLLPTDLEQVSPDSDKKSLLEQIEEEIVEDEDFESPAFEPIEPMTADKNENSNLSAISGLTSQDSIENKSEPDEQLENRQETQLSQISSTQETVEVDPIPPPPCEETQIPPPPAEDEPEKSQFDLNKDSIEFTGTERKSMTLDDSNNSGEADKEKILQPEDVPSNTMEIDNLYENDTTDSSEMRMEIDLKTDDTTQETAESFKIDENSRDSMLTKEKDKHRHHHKPSSSKDKHHHKSTRHHHSSSSKPRHDDKNKTRSEKHKKSSSACDKEKMPVDKIKTPGEKEKNSAEKDRSSTSSKDKITSKLHKDDHQQEKLSLKKRPSIDRDSKEGKEESVKVPADPVAKADEESLLKNPENKLVVENSILGETTEMSVDSNSSKKEKSSILVKYDYLKSKSFSDEIDDGFCGFTEIPKKLPENPWFECLRKEVKKSQEKEKSSVEQKKTELNLQPPRGKKQKSKSPGKEFLSFFPKFYF